MYLHLSAVVLQAICLAILLVLAILVFRAKRKAPSRSRRRRFRFTGVAVGNALQMLHLYVDPRVRYVIEQRLEEEAGGDGEENCADDCADPEKHFRRQLRRIRRGEPVDRLTIRMKEKN
jgi:hypothetical protein